MRKKMSSVGREVEQPYFFVSVSIKEAGNNGQLEPVQADFC
jgi:hypothetical protein